jgi:TatD DNase family protein
LDYYREDIELALDQIEKNRILTISNSVDPHAYERNQEIAKTCDWVLPAFGVHPLWAPKYADHLRYLTSMVNQSPMIGETGLDHHHAKNASHYTDQKKVFEFLLAVAREQQKIITVHTKAAEKEALEILDGYDIHRVIIHWYQGSLDVLHELTARGMYFSIGFEVLFSEHIQIIAQEIPSAQLLTETDNPAAKSRTGTQPMPLLVKKVVAAIARLRGTSAQEIIKTVKNNFARMIRDDLWLSGTYERFFK